jgi:hypothetical protein
VEVQFCFVLLKKKEKEKRAPLKTLGKPETAQSRPGNKTNKTQPFKHLNFRV